MLDPQRPTNVRYGVVAFASAVSIILYVDRVCISQSGTTIQKEFQLTKDQMGTVYSAFTLAYALFKIPQVTWRFPFYLFGAVGLAWAAAFFLWYRDDPQSHPRVNEAERALLRENAHILRGDSEVPWARFCGSPTTWLIWLQYFCFS